MHTISCSDGMELHFPSLALKMEYKRDEKMLMLRYYVKIRNQFGIWAGNQSKFVEHVDDLRPMDSHYMESLVSRYAEDLDIDIEPHRGRAKLNGML